MPKILAAILLGLVLAAAGVAQTPTTDMISGSDLSRNLDPQTLANKHYTKGLTFLRKADKALEKGQPAEKVEKNLERAADYFQQAVNQYYNLGVAHCELGCTLLRLERLEEAQSALMVAAALEPSSARVAECKQQLAEAKRQAMQQEATEPGA